MGLGNFNKYNNTIKEAKQSKPQRNYKTAILQHKQKEQQAQQKKSNKDKDDTPVTTMKVHQDSLMALSALQQMFYLDSRTEAFSKIMKDVVKYYIKNKKINRIKFHMIYDMDMHKK